MSKEEAQHKFGFLLAHLNMALRRMVVLHLALTGFVHSRRQRIIRDFIAFPKNNQWKGCDDRCAINH